MKIRSIAVLLVLMIPLFAVMANLPATADCGGDDCPIPLPWAITQNTTIASQTLEVGRNITVKEGATMTIKDSTLVFVLNATDSYYKFIIEEGGTLVVKNSVIRASVEYLSFIMQCRGKVTIHDSTISHLASMPGGEVHLGGIMVMSNETDIQRTNIYYGNIGVSLINCHQITFKDNIINDTYIALSSDGSEVTITDNEILRTSYGFYDLDSDNVYEDNHLYLASEPVYSFYSRPRITGNTINGSEVGIVIISCNNVTIDNNTLLNNGKAMQIVDTTDSVIRDNEVVGGIEGIKLDYSDVDVISNNIYDQDAYVIEVTDCSGCSKPQVQGMGSCIYLSMSDCLIEDNTLNNSNIGVYSYFSSPLIRNNLIHNMTDPVYCWRIGDSPNIGNTQSVFQRYCNSTTCRVDENIIIYEAIGLLAGFGLSFKGWSETDPVVENNRITDNENDGVFLWYSQPSFQDNIIADNGGFGIHALGNDITSSTGDTLSGNREAFGFSLFKTFRFNDPYSSMVPYTEVTIKDLTSETAHTLFTDELSSFSAILLSYTASEHRTPDQATGVHSYELTYNSGGTGDNSTYIAEPTDEQYTTLTIPLYRPDIVVDDVWVKGAYKGEQVKITAFIQNDGDIVAENVSLNFYYTYQDESQYSESKVIKKYNIKSLGEGKTEEVVIYWTPEETGNYTIIVEADPDRNIREISEHNNEVIGQITVEEKASVPTWLILSLLFGILVIVIIIFIGLYFVKKKGLDVKAPEVLSSSELPSADSDKDSRGDVGVVSAGEDEPGEEPKPKGGQRR